MFCISLVFPVLFGITFPCLCLPGSSCVPFYLSVKLLKDRAGETGRAHQPVSPGMSRNDQNSGIHHQQLALTVILHLKKKKKMALYFVFCAHQQSCYYSSHDGQNRKALVKTNMNSAKFWPYYIVTVHYQMLGLNLRQTLLKYDIINDTLSYSWSFLFLLRLYSASMHRGCW